MTKVFTPLDYGKGLRDGDAEKDRNALQFAIDRAMGWTPAGGLPAAVSKQRTAVGSVRIPPGAWTIDGPIEAWSTAHLDIGGAGNATLVQPAVGVSLPAAFDLNGFKYSHLHDLRIQQASGDTAVSGAGVAVRWDSSTSAATASQTSFSNVLVRGNFTNAWHIGVDSTAGPDMASIHYRNCRAYGAFLTGDTPGASASSQAGWRFEYASNLLVHTIHGCTISGFAHAVNQQAGVDGVEIRGLNAVNNDVVFYGLGTAGQTTIESFRSERARALFFRQGGTATASLTFRNGEFNCGHMTDGELGDWRSAGHLTLENIRINDVGLPGAAADPYITVNTSNPCHISLTGLDQRWPDAVGATGFVQPAGASPVTVSVNGVFRRTEAESGSVTQALANTAG